MKGDNEWLFAQEYPAYVGNGPSFCRPAADRRGIVANLSQSGLERP